MYYPGAWRSTLGFFVSGERVLESVREDRVVRVLHGLRKLVYVVVVVATTTSMLVALLGSASDSTRVSLNVILNENVINVQMFVTKNGIAGEGDEAAF